MRIAVAGGTGRAGAQAVAVARERGHDVVVLSRSAGVDLITGVGAVAALAGADVVIDASGVQGKDDPLAFHEAVMRTLVAARPPHVVVLSIVGVDRAAMYPLYAAKLAQERAIAESGIPHTIARVTQFHEFAAQAYEFAALGPVHGAPRMRSQPVAAREVGERLVDLAEAPPAGRAAELAGPREESVDAMVKDYAKASGRGGLIVPVPVPGAFGRAVRAGALLPGPDAVIGRQTFAEWIAAQRR